MEWKLKDLTVDGKGSYGIGAPAVPYQEDKLTYLRITDINDDGSLNYSDLKSVDAEDAEKYILKENDIVFARTGNSTGRSYFYEKQHGTFVYAGFLIKFSLDPNKVNPRILKYYTHSKPYFDWVNSFDTGATRGNINAKTYGDMEIELPSRKVQDKIVAILSSLDRKIELNNKINADLEEMAQAIFKNWFVDFEPFKDDKFVDSELGMIPEGWKVGSLGDFCNVFTGKKNTNQAIEKGLYPFFSCAPEPLASNDAIFNGKAIIIAGNGSYTGRTSFYNGGFDLYQRTYACTIREQDKKNLMIFFYHMMKQFFEPTKMGGTRGSSIPYIVMGDITQQKFPYSKDWLIRFSNIANSMMDRKLRIDKENSRLSLLRDTLLPRLMSGELEVPE